MECIIKTGDVYKSVEEFIKRLKQFQIETNSVFYRRSKTNIATARRKRVRRYINPNLPYQIHYCCIHGGRKPLKRFEDNSRKSRTFQKGCPSNIQLVVTEDGNSLKVVNTNFNHNHDTTSNLCKHLPQNRKLNPEESKKVEEFILAGGNKMIKNILESQSNKVILLKDLRNLQYKLKNKSNSLSHVVELLENNYGAGVELLIENDTFTGMFFQTNEMVAMMEAYPEFIAIDTYKLLNIRTPVYILLVEDACGQSEIVAAAILVSEDRESLEWLVNSFKRNNPSSARNRVIMSDKDLNERQVLKQHFPDSHVIICIFHTLKTFNRELNCEKLGITPRQRDCAKEIFLYHGMLEERDHTAAYEYLKVPQIRLEKHTPQYMYSNLLTNYAYGFVHKELEFINKIKMNPCQNESSTYIIKSGSQILTVTTSTCSCSIRVSMMLPCRHILAVRNAENLDLFSEDLCNVRWRVSYARRNQRIFHNSNIIHTEAGDSVVITDSLQSTLKKKLNKYEKYKKIMLILRDVATLISEQSGNIFEISVQEILKLKNIILEGKPIQVSELGIDVNLESNEFDTIEINETENIQINNIDLNKTDYVATNQTDNIDINKTTTNRITDHSYSKTTENTITESCIDKNRLDTNISSFVDDVDDFIPGEIQNICNVSTCITTEMVDGIENNNYLIEENVVIEDFIIQDNDPATQIETDTDDDIFHSGDLETTTDVHPPIISKSNLKNIIIPKVSKKRGRPKGCDATIIGLPKRSRLATRKTQFLKKSSSEKKLLMLKWISPTHYEEIYKRNKKMEENDIGTDVSYSLLDERVNLNLIRDSCTDLSSSKLNAVLQDKKDLPLFCIKCNDVLIKDIMSIQCQSCLEWLHLFCVGLKRKPKIKNWLCRYC